MSDIKAPLAELLRVLSTLQRDEQILALNEIRQALHSAGPFREEPVDLVLWVQACSVKANEYNPNAVAPPEMALLAHSIRSDGYTQPIVTNESEGQYEIVDGFHRNRVGREVEDIKERLGGYLPLTVINRSRAEQKDRIASTIRHNRARGVHGIQPMSEIVARLYFNGWSNKRIAEELGMDKDEVLRLKQFTGLGNLFEHRSYSRSWDLEDSAALDGEDADAD